MTEIQRGCTLDAGHHARHAGTQRHGTTGEAQWGAMGRAARIKVETEFDKNALNDELVRLYTAVVARNGA